MKVAYSTVPSASQMAASNLMLVKLASRHVLAVLLPPMFLVTFTCLAAATVAGERSTVDGLVRHWLVTNIFYLFVRVVSLAASIKVIFH